MGISAGFLGALLTINRWAETKGSYESGLAGLVLVAVFIGYVNRWHETQVSYRRAAGLGALGGVAILVSATLGSAVLGLLLASYVLFRHENRSGPLQFVFINAIAMLAVMSPWALRNYHVLGAPIWMRSNFGLELDISNNDAANANFDDRPGCTEGNSSPGEPDRTEPDRGTGRS